MIGPNCIGIVSFHNRPAASFFTGLERPVPMAGPIAFLTQSGGVCNAILTKAADRLMGLGTLVSTGNELDLETASISPTHIPRCRPQSQITSPPALMI